MAYKISCIILISSLLYFSLIAQISCSETLNHASYSVSFLKSLEGSRRDQRVSDLHKLRNYLARFGYLDNHSTNNVEDDQLFDERVENAIKTYQLNYGLNVTGHLDAHTVTQMMKPRCGFPDIINGINTMQPQPKSRKLKSRRSLHAVEGKKWPPSAYKGTYRIESKTLVPGAENMKSIVNTALTKWIQHCPFTFTEVDEGSTSNLVYGFYGGNHGDGRPFDAQGGILAHAFFPTDGRAHFDTAEHWSENPDKSQTDLESVVLHESGHLLGLAHTSDTSAVMYATLEQGVTKRELQQDDIDGIQSIYSGL